MTPEAIRDILIPATLKLANDPIPNIRFNVAKTFIAIIPVLKKANMNNILSDQIRPTLATLNNDKDLDVKFFASKAISVV